MSQGGVAMKNPRLFYFRFCAQLMLLGLVSVAGPSSAVAAQDFYDEVGRLLYSIDPEGNVAMFETDALDNTLSVTRGTRESMRPTISEVNPPTIQSGKTTVVIFKGANLVGTKFSTKTAGVRFGGAAPRAKSVGVPIELESSVDLGPLTVELSTPIGTTEVVLTVTEPKVEFATTTEKPEAKPRELPAGKPESCPAEMVAIAGPNGGFCIDLAETRSDDWVEVEKVCSYNFKRLCWSDEWERACTENQRTPLGVQNMTGEWEWTRTSEYAAAGALGSGGVVTENEDWLAVVRGKKECGSKDRRDPWTGGKRPGRCCK
jgi:hypothetical protein